MREWALRTKVGKRANTLGTLASRTRKGANTGMHLMGDLLVKEFKKQVMAKNKKGKIYRLKGRIHRASAPSQTPANRTGHYKDMIGFYVSNLNLTFGNNAHYAEYLEDGTRNMYPRYGLKNTIKAVGDEKMVTVLENAIKRSVN